MQSLATRTNASRAMAPATAARQRRPRRRRRRCRARGRVPRHAARLLDGHEHVGAAVLDRLELADGPAELLAHGRVRATRSRRTRRRRPRPRRRRARHRRRARVSRVSPGELDGGARRRARGWRGGGWGRATRAASPAESVAADDAPALLAVERRGTTTTSASAPPSTGPLVPDSSSPPWADRRPVSVAPSATAPTVGRRRDPDGRATTPTRRPHRGQDRARRKDPAELLDDDGELGEPVALAPEASSTCRPNHPARPASAQNGGSDSSVASTAWRSTEGGSAWP